MNHEGYTVETIETLEGLEKIKEDWKNLFDLKKEKSIFFSFGVFKIYYTTIIENFKNTKIEIFVIRNKNRKVVAIFPFIFETEQKFLLRFRRLFVKGPNRIGFYYFLIDPREEPDIIFQRFIEYQKNNTKKWDVIKFHLVPENEELYKVCKSIFTSQYRTKEIETCTQVVNCNSNFDEYAESNVKGRRIKDIKRSIRRLSEVGKLNFIEVKGKQDIEKGLKYFYDIEDKNWKGQKGTSLLRTYQGDFYKKLAFHFSEDDSVRIYLLQLNDRYVAGAYVIVDREIFYLMKIGYDEDFYQYSPSILLMYFLFKKIFGDNEIIKFDYFGPFYSWEEIFGGYLRKRHDFFVYNNKANSQVYYLFENYYVPFFEWMVRKIKRTSNDD